MATYPPNPATLSDPNVTASRFLASPNFVARRLQTLGDLRYIGTSLLTGRMETTGGAVGYEGVEGIFADATPEVVAPGSEYTLTTIQDGPAGLARWRSGARTRSSPMRRSSVATWTRSSVGC